VPAHRRGLDEARHFPRSRRRAGRASVTIDADAEIGRNVVLARPHQDWRRCAHRRRLHSQRHRVGAGAVLLPYTVASQSSIGPGAKVGPFAHLRPGTELGPDVHVAITWKPKRRAWAAAASQPPPTWATTIVGEGVTWARAPSRDYNGYEKRRPSSRTAPHRLRHATGLAPVRVGSAQWGRGCHHHRGHPRTERRHTRFRLSRSTDTRIKWRNAMRNKAAAQTPDIDSRQLPSPQSAR